VVAEDTSEAKLTKMADFQRKYVPYALAFVEDFAICCDFFGALHAGVQALDAKDISAEDKAAWDDAASYLALRR
jgi:hypothetical protein